MRIFIVIIISFLVQSCSSNKKQEILLNDKAEVNKFWNGFSDPNLNTLIKESLTYNTDVLTAMVNVSKAQSYLGMTQSNRLPDVKARAAFAKNRDSENMNSTFMHESYSNFDVAMVMSYQIDLWGKMAAASKSAKAQLSALESTKKAVEITIATEVAKDYFNIMALDNKIYYSKKLLALNEELVRLKLKQFKYGLVDASAVEKFNSDLYEMNSKLISLKQNLLNQENSLAVMLGRDVNKSIIARGMDIEKTPILPMPKDISSKVLLNRPDIIAAEHILEASKYQVKVARASYFPEISLNSLLGVASNYSSTLFNSDSRAKKIGVSLDLPILNYGKVAANVGYAEADKSQAMIDYKHVIKVAFSEALTSMEANKNASLDLVNAKNIELSMYKTNKIANVRFKKGLIDKLNKIEEEKRYINAKINVIDMTRIRLNSTIDLFKALGGNLD